MLVLKQDGVEISKVEEGGWFRLPNGDFVSPAVDGWESGPFRLSYVPPDGGDATVSATDVQYNMTLSFAQLLIGLVKEGWITEAEGLAWLKRELPAAVTSLIATLPANQRFAATARAADPSFVRRTDPLVIALATAQGKTAEQIDTFFTTYANV